MGHRPAADAACVARLKRAEQSSGQDGHGIFVVWPNAQSHDLTRTPGGSSSGAVAVADRGAVAPPDRRFHDPSGAFCGI
jgi:Asp-tRNA(Asn)/Glu-tRNA(Gln) amidotransferase A subunit family amidase